MRKTILTGLIVLPIILMGFAVPAAAADPPREVKTIQETLGVNNPKFLSGGAYLYITHQTPSLVNLIDSGMLTSPMPGSTQAVGGAAAALIPYRSPVASFSRNILISRDFGNITYQTEPHISVNPKDSNNLIVGMIDYNFPGVVTYSSFDGGATWQGPFQPKIPRHQFAGVGDPVTAFGKDGTAYICQMTVTQEKFEVGGVVGYAEVSSIIVSRSTDGGLTWSEASTAIPGAVFTQDYQVPEGERARGDVYSFFVDKPWMTVGPSPTNPTKEIIYLTFTTFIEVDTLVWLDELPGLMVAEEVAVIEMVRSEDGGKTWTEPVEVSPYVYTTAHGAEQDRLVHGSQPMVAPDGTLYVAYMDTWLDGAWEGDAEIIVATSKDKGQTFTRRAAAHFVEMDYLPRGASFRVWATGFPQTAIGPNGEIYIAYTAYPSDRATDSGDIYMVASTDGGRTYSLPKRVNDDVSDHLQFFPSISTSPDGKVHMMWGDTRDDRGELTYHIYYSSSTDGGKTWAMNARVTDFPSNPNLGFPYGAFIGDYFSMKATGSDVYMVWADSRLGEVMGYNQKIGFARQRAMPTPQLFLSPPAGAAGRDVIVQGSNFQPDSEIFISMGGVIISTGFTDLQGNFMQTIYAPIAGEGARDIAVSDISGNVALASFFTEFGFDTFEKGLADLSTKIDGMNAAPPENEGGSNDWLVATLGGALFVSLLAVLALFIRMRQSK
ncbi:exo-alpha-sialidase [Dehalogenimonas alkenigignens]|uniref:exo-alpha-sialidase n=1 Tax=Dehalogenimonas alkenigignens TaxID=1217799 RepID=A0A0W0GKR5_9CHLR|nr:sialidase family protein [Dehalogenimonas alkenigignens]KTB49149.1 BNR repeat-like domain [Dehalogenimonas alkenigignens]PVV83661.1 exo-alpha-sialidase [Dehalogenimonas alkenigignens]